jgi:hypothetical protein
MRNNFSEILNLPFESYQSFGSETPTADPICRTYNNIFGLALNTHMTIVDDKRVIVGHYINTPEWDRFINSSVWGGLDFRHAGYYSLCQYLNDMGLTGKKGTLNGDVVYWVEDWSQIPTPDAPTAVYNTESQIPRKLEEFNINASIFEGTVPEVINKLNESTAFKWVWNGEQYIGYNENTIIKL